MKLFVTEVTPEKAAEWLERGGKNRKFRRSHAERLAYEMASGKWVLNGDTIKFSSDGKLIDGQHRLSGVVISGVTVQMAVAMGVNDDRAFETIDVTILKRGAHQIAQMEGIESANTKVAIARRMLAWDATVNKKEFRLSGECFDKVHTFEVLDYLRANHDELTSIYEGIKTSVVYKKCGAPAALVAALIVCNREDEVATMLFIEGLKTGANLEEGSPIQFLRERLMFPPERRRGSDWNTEVMALTIKAWNCFVKNKPMKNLRWRQKGPAAEKFPTPRGEVA